MLKNKYHFFFYFILLFISFFYCVSWRNNNPSKPKQAIALDRVVINAPFLIMLYGSDPYLATNIEFIKISANAYNYELDKIDTFYLTRSQQEIARLNPCHENNYYWANAFLSHSGMVAKGNNILVIASNCRFWDGLPPFLYGINEALFNNNIDEAIKALTLSSQRWDINRVAINNMIISLKAKRFNIAEQSLVFLQHEYKTTKDKKSKNSLLKRITRIEQLIVLRNAQKEYEAKYGELEYLDQLVERQILDELPEDPLFLGFEIRNGRVEIKQIKFNQEQYETP